MMRYSVVILLLTAPTFAAEPALAIRNATVETLSSAGRIEKATVLVRNGKIEAVGKNVAIPDDATIIDAAGGTVMPGIIDPHFEVSIAGETAETGPRTIVIGGRTITMGGGGFAQGGAFTRIADNFYPYDSGYKPLPRVGLARLNLVTNGNGQSAIVRVTPSDPERMMDQPDGIAYISATNSSTSLDQLRARLDSNNRGGGRGGPGGGRGGFGGGFPGGGASNAGNQLWASVRDGKTPLIISCANSATIVHVMKILDAHKNVKVALFAPGNAFAEAADAVKGHGNVRALVRPNLELLPNTRDRFAPARLLNNAGIEFAFTAAANPPAGAPGEPPGSNDSSSQDFPLFPVAMMVKAGLPRQIALEALTKKPAILLGIESTHGTIEPGKVADLALYTGDPLDPASRLRLTLVDGRTSHAND